MKKNRPGTLVSDRAARTAADAIARSCSAIPTTIGVRYQEMLRDRPRPCRWSRSTRRSARSGSKWRRRRRQRAERRPGVRRLRTDRGRTWHADQGRAGDCDKAWLDRDGTGPGIKAGSRSESASESESVRMTPFLHHDRDRLRQQPPASRDGVREDRR